MKKEEIIFQLNDSIKLTASKSALKLKKHLIIVLQDLLEKDLTTAQNTLLESKINYLFNKTDFSEISTIELKKKCDELHEFLKTKLFLYPENHYTLFLGFMGLMAGLSIQSLSLIYLKGSFMNFYSGLILMFVASFVGIMLDSSIKKQGRTIRSTNYF
ncbi:hypothetical protein LNP80_02500 [Chryseobacterium sp. C-39]|uniref:Uncharacterized protein n=1 Tax=Chryseobacterium muglaense TaxID=2893752 RepID=A0A9Q3YRU4_9FLAO|nr:hypothetical protein [Chryseobacterium muglaense]MBD3907112.1 hypothetical protein [Chryseobacterium muglaense]MCC9033127.1 hypothetical protein [Chryseobacterium muglaense]